MYAVTIYTTGPTCSRCTMTKTACERAGVEYREVNVRDDAGALAYIEDLGYTEAPVVVAEDGTGEDHWCGFRPDQIKRIARAHLND